MDLGSTQEVSKCIGCLWHWWTLGMWCYLVNATSKTEEEVKLYYEKLMVEIRKIEAGLVPLPRDDAVII